MKRLRIIGFVLLLSTKLTAQNWDIDITKGINPDNPNSAFWKGMSTSVSVVAVAVPATYFTMGLVKKQPELKHKSYEMVGAFLIETTLTQGLKYSINRMRPAEKYPDQIHPYKDLHGKSMPSGHTALAFATATSLSLNNGKWYVIVPAYLWAAGVGYSRMYLGAHYFSDVMVGAAVGVASGFASHYIFHKWIYKEKPNQSSRSVGL